MDVWFRSEHSSECLYETWLRWGRAVGCMVVIMLRLKLNVVLWDSRILIMTLVFNTKKQNPGSQLTAEADPVGWY